MNILLLLGLTCLILAGAGCIFGRINPIRLMLDEQREANRQRALERELRKLRKAS